jgi:hypothetical protein
VILRVLRRWLDLRFANLSLLKRAICITKQTRHPAQTSHLTESRRGALSLAPFVRCEASEDLVAAALQEASAVPLSAVDAIHVAAAKRSKADELVTAERPGKPLHKVRGLKVRFLPNV